MAVGLHDLLLDFLEGVETGFDKEVIFDLLACPFLEGGAVVGLNTSNGTINASLGSFITNFLRDLEVTGTIMML